MSRETGDTGGNAAAPSFADAPRAAKAVANAIRDAGVHLSASHRGGSHPLAPEFERLSQAVARETPEALIEALRTAANANPASLVAWLAATAEGGGETREVDAQDEPSSTGAAPDHATQVGPGGLGYLMTLEKSDKAEIDWGRKDLA